VVQAKWIKDQKELKDFLYKLVIEVSGFKFGPEFLY
jgi:hypothetical protein